MYEIIVRAVLHHRKQGTGLGLYVARELAHANMGQLHYHPEMNGFELILPKEQAQDE